MAFFRKRDRSQQTRPDVPTNTHRRDSASGSRIPITDPGLGQHDPRQLLYQVLNASGLSTVLASPLPVEQTVDMATKLAPILRESRPLRLGFLELNQDAETKWAAIDGPNGSAVIVIASPQSDSDLMITSIVQPFERSPHPYWHDMVFTGSTTPEFESIIASADVAPVWEFPSLNHVAPGNGFPTLPASVRRAARSWGRMGRDLYRRSFYTQDGDETPVFVGLLDTPGWPQLCIPLGDRPDANISHLDQLTSASPYELLPFEDTLLFARRLPEGIDEVELNRLAQSAVDDLQSRWQALESAVRPGAPTELPSASIWERLEKPAAGLIPAQRFSWPTSPVSYTFTERIRPIFPHDEASFESIAALAQRLHAHRDSGFEYAWRSDVDARLTPSSLTFKAAAVDLPTGRFVGVGHPTHEIWNLSPAHDLGAIDGRNGITFTEQGHPGGLYWPTTPLYVGSAQTGVVSPLDATANYISVDLDGPTGRIAALAFLGGSIGAVNLYEASGQRRVLTVIEDVSGGEPTRFSANGEWVLVSGSRSSTVVETATGRRLRLEVPNASWWPLGESSLLSVSHENGAAIPRLFSLASNSYSHTFPKIALDVPLLATYPHAWFPSASPDGSELLVHTPAGVSPEFQAEHGVGKHLARVSLATGQGQLVHPVFLDQASTLERDVQDARWSGRYPNTEIDLHSSLAVRLEAPVSEHEYLHPGRWAAEAERLLVVTLNHAIDLTKRGEDVSHLMPEILAALVPIAHDNDVWQQQAEWLLGLEDTVGNLIIDGSLGGSLGEAWGHYCSAIAAIRAGRPDLIDPLAAAWVSVG